MTNSLLFVLAVVQGITEFLPISSDGHLALVSRFWGGSAAPLRLVLLLHAGTFAATLWVFREDILRMLRSLWRFLRRASTPDDETSLAQIRAVVVASIPTAVVGLALHDRVESWANNLVIVAVCLLLTAALCISTRFAKSAMVQATPSVLAMFLVGVAQGLAVLPGLSRSASTIAALRRVGCEPSAAFRLSFLMSLPAVGGAILLELAKLGADFLPQTLPEWVALLITLGVGIAALLGLRSLVARGHFWIFAVYLVPLAIALFVLAS